MRWLLAALTIVASFLAGHKATAGPSDPRPYLLQIGAENDVVGITTAPNGYSFALLSNGRIAVTGPDQLIRPSVAIPAMGAPRAIATNLWLNLADETEVRLYVASDTKIWIANYSVETGTLTDTTFASYTMPAGKTPQYMAVQPAANGAVYVCGSDTAVTPGTTKNFLMKIGFDLTNPAFKTWGQDKFGAFYRSEARNLVSAITVDADGNSYVAGQWDAVYFTGPAFYWQLAFREIGWSISTTGLGNFGSIQTSLQTLYFPFFFFITEAENRTGYIVKFNSSLNATNYTHTTDRVPNYHFWAANSVESNVSSFAELKLYNGFLYATGNWAGYSAYGDDQTFGDNTNLHVLRFDTNLSIQNRAAARTTGNANEVQALDVDLAGNVFVGGKLGDPATTFSGTPAQTLAGRSFFFGKLTENLATWSEVVKSNSPAPLVFRRAHVRANTKTSQTALLGTFADGQLNLGEAANPSLIPSQPTRGYVNFYALMDQNGDLINQLGLTVRSLFVDGSQVTVAIGDNRPAPMTNFDPVIHEGTVSLLSDATGTEVTVAVPKRLYIDAQGNQLFPEYDARNNEIAPAAAVTRHICTGFSVTGEATTGATNTYTFILSKPTRVIFNWRTEHALQVSSAVSSDLGIQEANALALGRPDPAVNKYWIEENQPVATFIDGTALDLANPGKRYRVSGFDATGSALLRPPPLPPLPASRVLLTAEATLQNGSPEVTLTNGALLQIGWLVTGEGIPAGATIVAKSGQTNFTLSANATLSGARKLTFNDSLVQRTVSATLAKGQTAVTLASSSGIQEGWLVSGPSIPLGTAVASVASPTSVTLTKAPVPVSLSSKTTKAPTVPVTGVATNTTTGSATASVPGGARISVGMTVTEPDGAPNIVPNNTTVTNVQNVTVSVSTTLSNNSPTAITPYNSQLTGGIPVTGRSRRPSPTTAMSLRCHRRRRSPSAFLFAAPGLPR
jgi:hypothetical protein